MHLLDLVSQTAQPVVVGRDEAIWRLPGTDALSSAVAHCPLRYVLHDDVTEMCTQLAFEADTILGSSLELLRVPAPGLWIEFVGAARRKVFSDFGRLGDRPGTSRQRIGLLVTSDEGGRRGSIEVCWESTAGLSPELAQVVIEFDFDEEGFSESGCAAGDPGCIGVTIGDHGVLNALFGRIRFRLRPEWLTYFRRRAAGAAGYRQTLLEAVDPLLEDVPFFAMFCLLLMSGGALRQQAGDRDRLNRARARRGRPPLLDHVELTMNLSPEGGASHGVVDRISPRLHFVRGHLVRRGNVVYWRTSHMRGRPDIGSIRSRTVSLRVAAG